MTLPTVACIMPTANRRDFVRRAVALFLAQDYPNKQLVIVEDGMDNCSDLIPQAKVGNSVIGHDHYGYTRRTIGEKRNVACELAEGADLIAHWDDDDWHSPRRISTQVNAMLARDPPARMCGNSCLVFLDDDANQAYLYRCGVKYPWLAGGTLMYERSLWRELGGFGARSSGEDTLFVEAAARVRTPMAILDEPSLYVAMLHGKNAEHRQRDSQWGGFDANRAREWMLSDRGASR